MLFSGCYDEDLLGRVLTHSMDMTNGDNRRNRRCISDEETAIEFTAHAL